MLAAQCSRCSGLAIFSGWAGAWTKTLTLAPGRASVPARFAHSQMAAFEPDRHQSRLAEDFRNDAAAGMPRTRWMEPVHECSR